MNNQQLKTAIAAVYRAGLGILEVYHASEGIEVTYKSDHSPLTMADRKAHDIISSTLKPLGLPILSEEGRTIPYEQRRAWPTFWLVDPLDGTKEFIKRNGEFTVNIALIHQTAPVLGAIYVPVKDELFFATRDKGAFKINDFSKHLAHGTPPVENSTQSIASLCTDAHRLPRPNAGKKGYVVVGSRSHASRDFEDYLQQLGKSHPDMAFVSAGSSLKFCIMAEGAADEYPRLGPTMEWDTAAGQIIAECAGAKVIDYETHQPLRYNKPSLLNPWFIVSGSG